MHNGCYGNNCIGKGSPHADICIIARREFSVAFLTEKSSSNKKQVVLDAENRGHYERLVEARRIKFSVTETIASYSLN